MEKSIIITKDGSHTVSIPAMKVTYHSHHGAIQESLHVYIKAGLLPLIDRQQSFIKILEIGFGTGLNALLTFIEAGKRNLPIHYTAIELYPLEIQEAVSLNYCEQLGKSDLLPIFEKLHQCSWEQDIPITNHFTLKKLQTNLSIIQPVNLSTFHLVYFDAFAPSAQPELWTKEVFEKIAAVMEPGGVLVTYCSKGDVRRAMQAAGLRIEKLPGPWGKREMVRARREP